MLGSLWTVKVITCPSLNSLHVYPIGLLKEIRFFSIEYLLVFSARQLQISGKVTSGKRDKFLHQFNIDASSGKTPSSVVSKFPMIDFSFSLSPLETFDSFIALKARSTNSVFCLP